MGEIIIFGLVMLSVPLIKSFKRGLSYEDADISALDAIWVIIVSAGFCYTFTNDIGSFLLDTFGGFLLGGFIVAVVVNLLNEKVWKPRIYEKKELERKEEEVRELRNEINEIKETINKK